jgi:hypothetical protein
MGGDCGGLYGIAQNPQGWPPLFGYIIEENQGDMQDPLLVEGGIDRLTYSRVEGAFQSRIRIRSLDDETRQELLAEMLGVEPASLGWTPGRQIAIEWRGQQELTAELDALRDGQESALRKNIEDFYAAGLITNEEAVSSRPRLAIEVSDQRQIPGPPIMLPPDPADPRTSVTLAVRLAT